LDLNGRELYHLAAQFFDPARQSACLGARPRDHDAPARQGTMSA
jgi:hypothetical protein